MIRKVLRGAVWGMAVVAIGMAVGTVLFFVTHISASKKPKPEAVMRIVVQKTCYVYDPSPKPIEDWEHYYNGHEMTRVLRSVSCPPCTCYRNLD